MLDRFFSTPERKSLHWPGRLLAGAGALDDALALVAAAHAPILILDRAFAGLSSAGGPAARYQIISAEPDDGDAAAAAALVDERPADLVVAIGGGSAIDIAKYAALRARDPVTAMRDRLRDDRLPRLVAVPTVSGSGSETSRFFIVSDTRTHIKHSCRSWSAVPDLTVLDRRLIASAGAGRLILGAFDTFLHLWETYICRNERTPFTEMLALAHIPELVACVSDLATNRRAPQDVAEYLAIASAMGGVAISNVRTGLIHTLGESLAAQVRLAHPLTLAVFAQEVFAHYAHGVEGQWQRLRTALAAAHADAAHWTLGDLGAFWIDALTRIGSTERIHGAVSGGELSLGGLCATVARDTVLAKEHPIALDAQDVERLAAAGLRRFGARFADADRREHAVNG